MTSQLLWVRQYPCKRYVGGLTPRTSEHDLIWQQGLHRSNQIKVRLLVQALIQYHWCPDEKRRRESWTQRQTCTEGRRCEDAGRMPSEDQGSERCIGKQGKSEIQAKPNELGRGNSGFCRRIQREPTLDVRLLGFRTETVNILSLSDCGILLQLTQGASKRIFIIILNFSSFIYGLVHLFEHNAVLNTMHFFIRIWTFQAPFLFPNINQKLTPKNS